MRNIPWTPTTVSEVSGALIIKGTPVNATDISIRRSIPSPLPAQVAGSGGFTATRGSAKMLDTAEVSESQPTPWGPQLPRPMDSAEAFATTNGQQATIFTGVVDGTSGSASGNDTDIELVDAYDRLNQPVSIRSYAAIMPPRTASGTTNNRPIDLMSTYFVDRVLRQCGFYATPPRTNYCVVSAPLQGSMWPEVGSLTNCGRDGTATLTPWWRDAPWGVACKSATADYEPLLDQYSAVDGTLSTRSLEISLCAGPIQNSSARVSCEWPDSTALAMTVTSSRSVMAMVMFSGSGGTWTTLATATEGMLGKGWQTAAVRFTPKGDGTMTVEIRSDKGGTSGVRNASIPYSIQTKAIQNVNVRMTDSSLGGLQVGFPGTPFQSVAFTPNAVLSPPVGYYSLGVSPAVQDEPAIDLLTSWAAAECAAMWIDEDGIFRWQNREQFTTGPIVWEGNSTNDLLDLTWSHDIQGAASKATVKYTDVAIQRVKRSRLVVWQGSGQTMELEDVMEDIIAPGSDEAWIGVDVGLDIFQAETSKNAFNRGEGSWAGYSAYTEDGDFAANGKYANYAATLEYIAADTWKLRQTYTGSKPSGVDNIKLQTNDELYGLKSQWQGFNLPVIRAQEKATFKEVSVDGSVRNAMANAPALVHECGWWVQSTTPASALAYWLAQQTASPLPVVNGVEIVADPRLQLGDKIRVYDSHRTGLQVTGIIIEIDQSVGAGNHSMTLRLMVTQVAAAKPTLYEYDQLWGGAQLAERDITWGNSTLAQFDANPLKR